MSNLGDEMIYYLISKEAISVFATYLLGRESPCYKEYSGKTDNWDVTRPTPTNADLILDMIYNIYRKSLSIVALDEDKTSLAISEKELSCLKTTSFIKLCFAQNEKLFTQLLVDLSYNNESFTIQSCEEITKYIEDITYNSEGDFIKLVKAILPVLDIKDDLQLLRFEIILGYPQIIIDDPTIRSKWPIFGYHKLTDYSGKYLEYKSSFNVRGCCCLFKKLSQLRSQKDRLVIEVFLLILEACIKNFALLKYIKLMSSDEIQWDDFINWGVQSIHTFNGRNNDTTYFNKLKEIVENNINSILSATMKDKSLLLGFRGFSGRYLLSDVKREEISLIMEGEGLYLIRIEYFTSILPAAKEMNLSKSASNYAVIHDNKNNDIDPSQNIQADETVEVWDINERPLNDKEFFKKILSSVSNNKKIVVQNKYKIDGCVSSMIRYVIFNTSHLDGTITMTINRPETFTDYNEHIPKYTVSNVSGHNYKNLLNVVKINSGLDWAGDIKSLSYNVQVDWNYKPSQGSYYYGNNYNC